MTDADIVNIFYLFIYKIKKKTPLCNHTKMYLLTTGLGEGGNVVSMLVRIPSVLRNEKMMNWVKKVLNFEKKEKDTFQFEAAYVPDTRKHHAF